MKHNGFSFCIFIVALPFLAPMPDAVGQPGEDSLLLESPYEVYLNCELTRLDDYLARGDAPIEGLELQGAIVLSNDETQEALLQDGQGWSANSFSENGQGRLGAGPYIVENAPPFAPYLFKSAASNSAVTYTNLATLIADVVVGINTPLVVELEEATNKAFVLNAGLADLYGNYTAFGTVDALQGLLDNLRPQAPKIAQGLTDQYTDRHSLFLSSPRHVVATYTDLKDPATRGNLNGYFELNPSCKLILDPGGNSILAPMDQGLPLSLRQLVLVDINKTLETIGNNFGRESIYLSHVETKGLTALKMAEDGFCAQAISLIHLSVRGMTAIKTIGEDFATQCPQLTEFDSHGFWSLQTIGDRFLAGNVRLKNIYPGGLVSLKSFTPGPLWGCLALGPLAQQGLGALVLDPVTGVPRFEINEGSVLEAVAAAFGRFTKYMFCASRATGGPKEKQA